MAPNSAKNSAKLKGSRLKLGTLIFFAELRRNLSTRSAIYDKSDPEPLLKTWSWTERNYSRLRLL